jgi:hypothetical protein
MKRATLALLLVYIDAAIEAALARHSCGPQRRVAIEHHRDARAAIEKHVAKDTEQ